MRRRFALTGLLAAALGSLVLAACGGGDDPLPALPTQAPVEVRELPNLNVDQARAAISSFDSVFSDPHEAERVTVPGECGGLGFESLEDAVQAADAIVVGRVSSVEFLFDGETRQLVRLDLEQVIRGNPQQLFVLNITGGPRELDGQMVLTQHATNPLLLPGDRALFLLQKMSLTAAFVPQGYSGQYRLSSGHVETTVGNPFSDTVRRMSEDALLKKVRKLANG